MNDFYVKPYNRMGPYVVGMLAGYFLYRTGCKLKIGKVGAIVIKWTCGRASSHAKQWAANSLWPLNLSEGLTGQLYFHSASLPLYLHIVCPPVGRMEYEEFEGKENSGTTMLLENVLLLM